MSDSTEQETHFTESEARALVGKTFTAAIEFAQVPQGTRGRVVAADHGGLGHWDIVIEWELPRRAPSSRTVELEGEQVTIVDTGKPIRDWFTKDETARYLRAQD